MNPRAPSFLLAALLALAAGAGGVLLADNAWPSRHDEGAREFQRLVGGLGFGPAVDLGRCAFSFDPRVCPVCPQDQGPIPGGMYFCPDHGCSILYYRPLEPVPPGRARTGPHALSP